MALLATGLLAAPRARAASLTFEGPGECPNAAFVIAQVEAERGRGLADEPEVAFAAVVSRSQDGTLELSVTTVTLDRSSVPERTLVATDCGELVTALVRVVSLVLGPVAPPPPSEREERDMAPERTLPLVSRSLPASAPDVVPMPAFSLPAAPDERPWFVTALAGVDAAAFGTFAGEGRLEGGHHFGQVLEARVGVAYLPPQDTRFDSPSGDTTLSFALFSGAALGCAAWTSPSLRVPLCAGVEIGELRARHAEDPGSGSERRVWVAGRLDARALFPLNPSIRLSLSASLALPWLRPRLLVDGALVHEIPAVSPRLSAGIEWAP